MPKQIRMPKLSDTMEEGTLLAWRVREGEPIRRGEVLAEIETDKADMEFESYTEGTVQKLCIGQGETVDIGTLIAIIRLPGESEEEVAAVAAAADVVTAAAPQAAAAAPSDAPPVAAPAVAQPAPVPVPHVAPGALPAPAAGDRVAPPYWDEERQRATPRARRLAEERSVDVTELEGSGPYGAIVVADVEGYLRELEAQAPDPEGVRATPLALRMASDQGIDLELVKGSGPGGRITRSDLEVHLRDTEKRASDREGELFRGAVQLSQKRKALIRNMVRSKAGAPHF